MSLLANLMLTGGALGGLDFVFNGMGDFQGLNFTL